MAVQLCAIGKSITAKWAWECFLVFLMPVFDVLFERGQPLIASITVRAGQQLGKVIWCSQCLIWMNKRRCNIEHEKVAKGLAKITH